MIEFQKVDGGRSRSVSPVRRSLALAAPLSAALAWTVPLHGETPAAACRARAETGDHRTCAAAVAAAPGDAELRRFYAISLQKAGLYDRALDQYAKVAAMEPKRFRAQYELGWMLAFVRRYGEAVGPLRRAAALRPAHIGAYRALTITFAMLRQPGEALKSAIAGARLGDPIAMFDVAGHYREGRGVRRDDRLALRWLERAARAGHVKAMDDLVQVYLNGELGQAPDDAKAEAWAAEAYRARNR